MAVELRYEVIPVTSFYPGVVLTERTQRAVESGDWAREVGIPLVNVESPNYKEMAIVAVATDPENTKKTGRFQAVAELASEYKFTEENGSTPQSIRSLRLR
jgi:hypothetical protein